MGWLIYLSKVSACMALFYTFYHFFLQKLTFFSINRVYLLSTLLLSFVIPALQLQVQRFVTESVDAAPVMNNYTGTFADLDTSGSLIPATVIETDKLIINWEQVLLVSYLLVATLMLSIFVFQTIHLLKQARKVDQRIGRLRVVFKGEGFTNCSFLNYVFLNKEELSEKEMHIFLQHELVHVSRYHSIDKLLMSALKALLWFSPLVYLYDKALENAHEYEADKEVSMSTGNTPYANALLAIAVRKNNPALVHSFVRNPLKGRIQMLFTHPSKNMKKLMYFTVLPIGLALTWTFAVQVVYAGQPEQTPKQTQLKPTQSRSADLKILPAGKKSEVKTPALATAPADTLWMIDGIFPGSHTVVIIDGNTYPKDILAKISPRCIGTKSVGRERIELTTRNKNIEYATKIDRQNVIARNKALASGKIYARYPQKSEDGSRYEWINIQLPGGGGGGVSLDKGKKLLLIYEGRQYTEREFKTLTADQLKSRAMSFSGGLSEEITAKYGKDYGSMIEISKPENQIAPDTISFKLKSNQKKIFRRPMGLEVEDAYGKFFYSAKDSTVYAKGLAEVLLYGDATMRNDLISIKADKIKFNGTDQIAWATNASFSQKGKAEIKDVPLVRFNLRAGTYLVLDERARF